MNSLQAIPIFGLLKNNKHIQKKLCLSSALLMTICMAIFQLLPNYHWLKFEIFIGEVQAPSGESIRQELRSKSRLEEFLNANKITKVETAKEIFELWSRDNFVFIHDVKISKDVGLTANFTCKYLGIVGNVSKESVEHFKRYVVEVLIEGLVREKALVQKQQLELLLKDIAARNEGLDFRISFLERHIARGNSPLGSIEEVDFNKLDRITFFNLLGDDGANKPRHNLKKLGKMRDYQAVLLAVAPAVELLIAQYEQVVSQTEGTGITPAVNEMLKLFRVEANPAVSFGHVIDPLPVFPLVAQLLLSAVFSGIGGVLFLIISHFRGRVKNGYAFV